MQAECLDQTLASRQWRRDEVDDGGLFSEHRHDTRGQLEACQCLSRLFANPPGCPDLRLAFRNVRENFQRCRNCFGKELEDMRRIEFLRLVRRLALHQIYLVFTASRSHNIDVALRVLEPNDSPELYVSPSPVPAVTLR